jgi:hypothetical protein
MIQNDHELAVMRARDARQDIVDDDRDRFQRLTLLAHVVARHAAAQRPVT